MPAVCWRMPYGKFRRRVSDKGQAMAKYRIFYGLVLAGSILFYTFYKEYLSAVVLLIVFLIPLLSLLLTLPACFLVRIRIRLEKDTAEKGEPVPLVMEVENRWVMPCALAQVKLRCVNHLGQSAEGDVFRPLDLMASTEAAARRRVVLRQSLVSRWCGKVEVSAAKVRVADLLRLFRLPVMGRPKTQEISILPRIQEVGVYPAEGSATLESERYSPYRPGDDPGEVFQVREFREGDSLRRVHWKLSQRMSTWMVRDFSQPIEYGLYVLVEPGASLSPELLDRMMEAFTSLSASMIQEGCIHRVGWMDGEVLRWEELEDLDSLSAVLENLLAVRAEKKRLALEECLEGKFPVRGGHLLYCTTQGKTEEEEKALLESLTFVKQERGLRQVTLLLAGNLPAGVDGGEDCTVVEIGEGLRGLEELIL